MNIKKALSLVAFGFLFTLVNLNLTVSGGTINVTPDFIGWILLFLAFDKLGNYVESKGFLKWISLGMAVMTCVIWGMETLKPELDAGSLKTLGAIVSLIYMYFLFGVLEQVAADSRSRYVSAIGTLKILNLVLYVGFIAAGLGVAAAGSSVLALLAAGIGVAALVCAVITAVVLFKLRREVRDRTEDTPGNFAP